MFNQYEHDVLDFERRTPPVLLFRNGSLVESLTYEVRQRSTLLRNESRVLHSAHPFHVSWIFGIKPITGSYSSPRAISFDFVPSSNGSPHTKAVMSIQYICTLFSESSTEMDVTGCCTICCQCTRSHEAMHSTQCVPLKRVRADVN